jgi:hypothetical protein
MSNPFEKRATEYLRDDEAFLSVVTPAPLFTYFEPKARDGVLYDRLVVVVGSPGSGKTTIATLVQFKTLETLRRQKGMENYRQLVHALTKCGLMRDEEILACGCRLPLESEYREFWELPYEEDLKTGLMHSLLQARAVISWLQNLTSRNRCSLDDIEITPRIDTPAAAAQIGGTSGRNLFEKACQVERDIYRVGSALVPPKAADFPALSIEAYEPFQVIEKFVVSSGEQVPREYIPLVVLDDAHSLHHTQLSRMLAWLARREQRVGRWVLMRLDSQTPQAALLDSFEDTAEGLSTKVAREVTTIWLQRRDDRRTQRSQFRSMAKDMADRYLRLMEIFTRSGVTSLTSVLDVSPESLGAGKLKELKKKVDRIQSDLKISAKTRKELEEEVRSYATGAEGDVAEDVQLAILRILMHRYARRLPQVSLFELTEELEPSRPVKANAEIAEGARIQLMHEFGRPYYFGLEVLCDGSSENAEQFLQLAGRLVSLSETRIIRSQPHSLPASLQHRELRSKATEMIAEWRFPERKAVGLLVEGIADQCFTKTMEPTAPLGAGPNAFGIPQSEFVKLPVTHPRLAEVLKYGIGYNALGIKQNHTTKHALWTLIELGGISIIKGGLGFRKGNFLERTADDLAKIVGASR